MPELKSDIKLLEGSQYLGKIENISKDLKQVSSNVDALLNKPSGNTILTGFKTFVGNLTSLLPSNKASKRSVTNEQNDQSELQKKGPGKP